MINKKTKKIVAITTAIIICLLLSFALGFEAGVKASIKAGLKILPYFTNITISEKAINDALFQYNNRIGGCLQKIQE